MCESSLRLRLRVQLVGSMDWPCFNLYKAAVRSQAGREEMVTEMYTTKTGADGKKEPGGMARQAHAHIPTLPFFHMCFLMLLEEEQLQARHGFVNGVGVGMREVVGVKCGTAQEWSVHFSQKDSFFAVC